MVDVINSGMLASLKVGLSKTIYTRGFKSTPAVNRYRKTVSEMEERMFFNKLTLSKMKDQLNGAYAAGDQFITVDGSSPMNPVTYYPGLTDLMIDDERFKVIQVVSGTVLKVIGAQKGTIAANHADNSTVKILNSNQFGVGILGRNDKDLSSRQYNYPSNYQNETVIAKRNAQDKVPRYTKVNEASSKQQLIYRYREADMQMEFDFFYGVRSTSGSVVGQADYLVTTAGEGESSTMGLKQGIGLDGGLVFDFANDPISENAFLDVLRQGRDGGFYNNITDNKTDDFEAIFYTSLQQGDAWQQLVQPYRIINEAVPTTLGTNVNVFILGGVKLKLERSSEVRPGDAFIVPASSVNQEESPFVINCQRYVEAQKEVDHGDRITYPYETTYMNELGGAMKSIFLTGLKVPTALTPS